MIDKEVDALVEEFAKCDLDCSAWDESALRELAVLAIETLDKVRGGTYEG